jgi:hypothetical protein
LNQKDFLKEFFDLKRQKEKERKKEKERFRRNNIYY